MKIALFGLPACGKGTQAQLLKEHYGFEQLSTGDMLRQMKEQPGEIGDKLRALPPGAFADDHLILEAVRLELTKDKYKKGVVFDGFPRTATQAEALLQSGLDLDAVIYFKANVDNLIERGVNRRVHIPSGRVYNLKTAPPKTDGVDDLTGEPLTWRDDDKADIMRQRFADFEQKTQPALATLKQVCQTGSGPVYTEVNADAAPDAVFSALQMELFAIKAIQTIRAGNIQQTVTIESPYAGDIAANERYARAAMRDCLLRGEACFASHLLYTQAGVLDDTCRAQRRLGIEAGLLFAQMTAKTVVYQDLGITPGMEEGVARAHKAKRPVEYRSLPEFAPAAPCVSSTGNSALNNPNPEWAHTHLELLKPFQQADLMRPEWRKGAAVRNSHDYVNAEALFHALGGTKTGWRPAVLEWEDGQHWVLRHASGTLLDPTWHHFGSLPDYSAAKPTKFHKPVPSERAKTLLMRAGWTVGSLTEVTAEFLTKTATSESLTL